MTRSEGRTFGLTPRITDPLVALVAASSRSLRFFSSPSTFAFRSSSCFLLSKAARFSSRRAACRSRSSFSCSEGRANDVSNHSRIPLEAEEDLRTFLAAAAARLTALTSIFGFFEMEVARALLLTDRLRVEVVETLEAMLLLAACFCTPVAL